ncbi:hypothetical protein NIES2119_10835 [[Phormidium ambiguum] IAM M-71]|uniref:DUF928 domain-containing protein n=1 Tax=[Phormidium ambiguum] IAM M-71 TaxID=454136 RepID=A0A1U7ILB6_9CYAN|nr:DUF928 domain-containing protein [Phormidium ambiguum]OKH38051.1 hypothetical protein NIES2119_10835 [Phormidium ambiguum IAM M-71]
MSKTFNRLLSICILTLFVSIASAAFAGYNPSSDQRQPRDNTASTGGRGGCSGRSKETLIALAPQQYIGQTVSLRPTFTWFVPDSQSYKMEFALYEYTSGNNKKLLKKIELNSSPGIMKLSLPESIPDLMVGKTYFWQVAVLCNEGYPSSDLITRAELEVVPLPTNVKTSLDTVKDPLQRSDIYANSGFWYDALSEALTADNTPQSRATISTLLEELANFESAEVSRELVKVANIKRQNIMNSENPESANI